MSGDLIDRDRLAESITGPAAAFERETTAGVVRPWVSATLDHNVLGISAFTQYGHDFEFRSDEAIERGGDGSAPSPLRYLLSSLAFCFQGWVAKSAALRAVELDSVSVDVRTLLDQRGELQVDDAPAHPQWFVIDLMTTGPAEPAAVDAVATEAGQRCPLTVLMGRAVPVYYRVTHNSERIRDERPASLQQEDREEQTR